VSVAQTGEVYLRLIFAAGHRQDGILNEGEGPPLENNDAIGFKSVLVRSLTQIIASTQDRELKDYIEDYLLLQ
jgi:hypothetical protein